MAYLSGISTFQQNLEGLDDIQGIESYLDSLPKLPQYFSINETVLFYRNDIESVIDRLKKRLQFNLISLNPIKLIYSNTSRNVESIFTTLVLIIPGSRPSTLRAIGIAKPSVWATITNKLSKSMYPYLMPIYYKQNELEKAFSSLQIYLGNDYQIRISDLTLKESRGIDFQTHINDQDTKRWWTNIPINEMFSLAKEQSFIFTSLKFSVEFEKTAYTPTKKTINGRISKFGRIYYSNSYSILNNGLISHLEEFSEKRLKLFENRSIRDQQFQQSKPIQISYSYDIFKDKEEIRKTGDIFSKYPNASRIEFHCNPYYHASIADFIDGSSFDIWITSLRKIIIIPQSKASVQAFERLTTFVFSNFGEGIVDDFVVD